MDYNAPSGSLDLDADYVGATASTQGSKIPPNMPMLTQREIVNAERCAGLTPSNADRSQLAQAIGRGIWVGDLGATVNRLVGAIGGGVPRAILTAALSWTQFSGFAQQANTQTGVAVSISGIGSLTGTISGALLRRDGLPLQPGDQPAGCFDFRWDGANFRLIGAARSEIVSVVLPYTPAGALFAISYTAYSLVTVNGVRTDNVAQTMDIGGATYIDCTGGCSANLQDTSATGKALDVTARIALFQGDSLLYDATSHAGARLISNTATTLTSRRVFRGLDPSKVYRLKLLVQKGDSMDNLAINDAELVAYYG